MLLQDRNASACELIVGSRVVERIDRFTHLECLISHDDGDSGSPCTEVVVTFITYPQPPPTRMLGDS